MNNWRTTLAGLLGGLIVAFGPAVGGRLQGDPNAPPITSQNYLPAIAIAVVSFLAKDKNVTGGSVLQPTPVPVLKAKEEEKADAGVASKP